MNVYVNLYFDNNFVQNKHFYVMPEEEYKLQLHRTPSIFVYFFQGKVLRLSREKFIGSGSSSTVMQDMALNVYGKVLSYECYVKWNI